MKCWRSFLTVINRNTSVEGYRLTLAISKLELQNNSWPALGSLFQKSSLLSVISMYVTIVIKETLFEFKRNWPYVEVWGRVILEVSNAGAVFHSV